MINGLDPMKKPDYPIHEPFRWKKPPPSDYFCWLGIGVGYLWFKWLQNQLQLTPATDPIDYILMYGHYLFLFMFVGWAILYLGVWIFNREDEWAVYFEPETAKIMLKQEEALRKRNEESNS